MGITERKKNMRKYGTAAFLLLIAVAISSALDGCAATGKASTQIVKSSFPRHETLYVGGFQWDTPGDFNPLSMRPSFPVSGNINLVYETLFSFNALTNSLSPILGTRYEFSGAVLTVELNENARWNDGVPLTVEDVIYTFYLHKRYPTNLSSHWRFIDTVYTRQNSIRFRMNRNFYNPLVMRDIITSTQILPKHVFEWVEAAAIMDVETSDAEVILARIRQNMMSRNVVSSGPYKIHSYAENLIALERDDNYWGNETLHNGRLPAPRFIVHPTYASNDDFSRAFEAGYLDVSQTFFAQNRANQVKQDIDAENGIGALYVPGAITALVVNFGEASEQFSPNPVLRSAEFRRALAWAINYEKIRTLALGGNIPAISSGFIINEGNESLFFSEEDVELYRINHNLDTARQILDAAGFTLSENGNLFAPDGKIIESISITLPRGWTDWEQAALIIVENLREIGVLVQVNLVREREYWHNLSMGFFDLIIYTPRPEQSASLPWSRFDATLNSQDLAPLGVAVWSNHGRFMNERISYLLRTIPPMRDTLQMKNAYRELNRLFMAELPVIPIMYRPKQFKQFSTEYWGISETDETSRSAALNLITAGNIKGLWEIAPKLR
ncbi:MAG: ABC transporter substrate-binding protein [Chitinivibrionia bacterium]|nr:ABC transporter substrate-binding protein [Chitinivibrionia bacterium]